MLFLYFFLMQALCIKGGFTVIADDQVFHSKVPGSNGHLFYCIGTIAPVAVTMDNSPDIGGQDDGMQAIFLNLFYYCRLFP